MKDLEERAEQTGHSTTSQAASIAKQAKVKNLIIGHFSQITNMYGKFHPVITICAILSPGAWNNRPKILTRFFNHQKTHFSIMGFFGTFYMSFRAISPI